MSEVKTTSIFDSGIDSIKVTRSNTRRNAMMIPLKKGKELAELMKKEMEKDKTTEETSPPSKKELENA